MAARTVGELKALIADLPDDMLIMTEGSDHSFNKSSASKVQSSFNKKYRTHHEYYGPEYRTAGTDEIVDILLVS